MPRDVTNWSSNRACDWVLSGDTSPVFLNVDCHPYDQNLTIASSDWVHDFAPTLGIGRFLVAELPVFEKSPPAGQLGQRLTKAVEAMREMREKLQDGEWDEVVEKARPVVELLKHNDFRDFLAEKLVYPQDAVDELWKSLDALFQFTSKFHHPTTKQGAVRQTLTATKEDAYLVYSLSLGLANLIGRKVAKAS
ncbi:MAG: hypothetical protein HY683_08525 [Chloroflexi bacterium]|nr:hypothetical protein [Chloroflexota bacterium]